MEALLSFFIEPLSHGFMQRGLLAALLVAVITAVFSCFLIVKGWSLLGDAVAHAVLPGLVLSAWLSWPLALGAILSGFFCAIATDFVKAKTDLKEETVLGIVFTALFALGLVLMTKVETDLHLMHVLFGNMLGVRLPDLFWLAGVGALVLLGLYLFRRALWLYSFDEQQAKLQGIRLQAMRLALLAAMILTITLALQAVGIILVIALLIAPGATAFLLTRHFAYMFPIAVALALASSLVGVYGGYYLDIAPAPLIVCVQALWFLLVWLSGLRPLKRVL